MTHLWIMEISMSSSVHLLFANQFIVPTTRYIEKEANCISIINIDTLRSLSSDDDDAEDDAQWKNEFLFYKRNSQLSRSVQYVNGS